MNNQPPMLQESANLNSQLNQQKIRESDYIQSTTFGGLSPSYMLLEKKRASKQTSFNLQPQKSNSQSKYRNMSFSNVPQSSQTKKMKNKRQNRSQQNFHASNRNFLGKWSVEQTNSSIEQMHVRNTGSSRRDNTQSQNAVPSLPLKHIGKNVNNFFVHKKQVEPAKKQLFQPNMQIQEDSQAGALNGQLLNFGGQQIDDGAFMDLQEESFIQPLTSQNQVNQQMMSNSNSGVSAGRPSNKKTMRPYTTQTQMAQSQQYPSGALQNLQGQNGYKIHWKGGYLNVMTNNEAGLPTQVQDLELPQIPGTMPEQYLDEQPAADAKQMIDNIDLDALNLDDLNSSDLIQYFQDGQGQYAYGAGETYNHNGEVLSVQDYNHYNTQALNNSGGADLTTAAQQLYQNNMSHQDFKAQKKYIMDYNMNDVNELGLDHSDANINTHKAERGISEILRISLKKSNGSRDKSANRAGALAQSNSGAIGTMQQTNPEKEYRLKQQEKVYQQNLGKLQDLKRSIYSRTLQEQMRNLPKNKNFIHKNKQGSTFKGTDAPMEGSASSIKLDRLKKLQAQTSNLINHNNQLEMHKYGQNTDADQNMMQQEAEDFLQQSINEAADMSGQNADENAKSMQMFMKSQQPQFDQNVQEQFDQDDEMSSRTLEQFKNLRKLSSQNKRRPNQRLSGSKTAGFFPKISQSRLKNTSGSRSKTRSGGTGRKSRSRSPQVNGVTHQRKWGARYPGRDDVEGLLANRGQIGEYNQTPGVLSPKQGLEGKGSRGKRVRSQTAGAGGAARARMNRGGASAAAVGQSWGGATTNVFGQRRSASNQRGSRPGRVGAASSTTTRKFGFGLQKSSVQQLGNLNLNFDETAAGERLSKDQSQSFINNIELDDSLPELKSDKVNSGKGSAKPASPGAGKLSSQSPRDLSKSFDPKAQQKSSSQSKIINTLQSKRTQSKKSSSKKYQGSISFRAVIKSPRQVVRAIKVNDTVKTQDLIAETSVPKTKGNKSNKNNNNNSQTPVRNSKTPGGIPKAPGSLAKPKKGVTTAKKNIGLHQNSSRSRVVAQNSPPPFSLKSEMQTSQEKPWQSRAQNMTDSQIGLRNMNPKSKDKTSFQISNRKNNNNDFIGTTANQKNDQEFSQRSRSGSQGVSQLQSAAMRSKMIVGVQEPQPIIDQDGNIVYPAKLRKPKWVLRSELTRFAQHEDSSLGIENSRNARIKMEDPFSRAPHLKTVFSHIRDSDIAKYIVGSSYLSKDQLDEKTTVGMHPGIRSQKLFMDEVALDTGPLQIEVTERLCREAIAYMLFEQCLYGVKDPNTNLRADPNFIVNFRLDDAHIEFRKCLVSRRAGTGMIKLIWKEAFGETSKEWLMAFDPVNTEKRSERYNRPLPECYKWRAKEMEYWREIFERRADFFEIRADQGQVINDIIDGIMYEYRRDHYEAKEKEKVRKNEEHLEYVLKELETSQDLVMPEIEFEPLPQLEREEFLELYNKHFKYDPEKDSRDALQAKLSLEFLKLRPIMQKYDLIDESTFHLAADQSDYKTRMRFIESLLDSEVWDIGIIINDDVYRAKQEKWMISMLTKFPNLESHEEQGIYTGVVAPKPKKICHLLVHEIIHENFFTFEKQDLFYFKWYRDYLVKGAQNKPSEYTNFFHFKGVHETALTRQQEGHHAKVDTWFRLKNSGLWSFQGLQDYIYRPTFTNILDPKNKLIKEPVKFKQHFAWFMSQFELKEPILPKEAADWQISHQPRDASRLLFLLHIDFEKDCGLAMTSGDPYPRAHERKYNDIVYRCKHLSPNHHQAAFEIFEVTFNLDKNFDDKEDVHEALELVLKKRKTTQYETQLALLRKRKIQMAQKLEDQAAHRDYLWKKYIKQEMKKPLRRARSLDESTPSWKRSVKKPTKKGETQTEGQIQAMDIRKAVIAGMFPWTAEFPFPTEDRVPEKPYFAESVKYRWDVTFGEPIVCKLEKYKYGYLQSLVDEYQQVRGIKSDEYIAKVEAERKVAEEERQRKIESEKRRIESEKRRIESEKRKQESEKLKQARSRRSSQRSGSSIPPKAPSSQASQIQTQKSFQEQSEQNVQVPDGSASESVIDVMDHEQLVMAAERGETPREMVAPYRSGKHVDNPQKEPFLSWIECCLGPDKKPERFIIYENKQVKMGPRREHRMFDDFEDQFYRRVLIVPEGKPFCPNKDWQRQPMKSSNRRVPAIAMNTDRLQGFGTLSPKNIVEIEISDRSHQSQQATQTKDEIVVPSSPSPIMNQLSGLMGGKQMRPQSGIPLSKRQPMEDLDGNMEILMVCEPRIPQYLPLHIKKSQITILKNSCQNENMGLVGLLGGSLSAMFKKIVEKPPAQYGATMNTSEKVLSYVDKQVRKEILEAVRTADVPLLKNFVEQFNKSLTREDQINFREEEKGSGDTILHQALLMDFTLKEQLITLGKVIHTPPQPKDGTGGPDDKPLPPLEDEVVDIKIIKKALSKETSSSSKIKIEVVKLLVEAGADPAVCNNHGHSSLSLAKNLNESSKIISIMKTKMNPNSWNKWF